MVVDRIGFIISKLERLAFRSSFDPVNASGDVAYNLTIVPDESLEAVTQVFDRVRDAGCSFFRSYNFLDRDPRIPSGHTGILTVCSITMDGVFQHHGIPVRMAYGGTIRLADKKPVDFVDLIGYQGSTTDPLQLFIDSGLTSIGSYINSGTGVLLANIRQIPGAAGEFADELIRQMQNCGFIFPLTSGSGQVFNLNTDPYRISLVSYSGMNFIGYAAEEGFRLHTEIGAGTIPFRKIVDGE